MFMFFVFKYHNKKSQIRCCHCEKDLENVQPLPIPYRFTHKWKTLEWSHYFTEKEVSSHKTSLTPPCFESRFCVFLQRLGWIVEQFWQCEICLFFILSSSTITTTPYCVRILCWKSTQTYFRVKLVNDIQTLPCF